MLRAKHDYSCRLIDCKTERELLRFQAGTVGDLIENASYVGGGVASAGQALTVWTEKAYSYAAYAQFVEIDGGKRYKLTSVQTGLRKRLGANRAQPKRVYILTLE